MALIKSLLAPIRRIVHFPLFQFIVTVAFILWLQAADSNSVFGEIFSALDRLVDFSVNRFAAFFECMSSEHFGQLAWQFKRVSGSSGLKV